MTETELPWYKVVHLQAFGGTVMEGHTAAIYEGTPGTRIRRPHVHLLGSTAEALVETARAEADAGATRVELCRGVGLTQAAAVLAAVSRSVAVGLVRYDYDSLDLITAYKQSFLRGNTPLGRPVFLYLDSVNGDAEWLDHEDAAFVPVSGPGNVPTALSPFLQGQPLGLVELYAGLGLDAAAAVWAATGGQTPVGFVDRHK